MATSCQCDEIFKASYFWSIGSGSFNNYDAPSPVRTSSGCFSSWFRALSVLGVYFRQRTILILYIGSGFGASGGQGKQGMSDEALAQETYSLRQSLSTIDARIEQARQELSKLSPYSEEKDIWETNLVMLQVREIPSPLRSFCLFFCFSGIKSFATDSFPETHGQSYT